MNHFATPEFWECYHALPEAIRELADKNFALLKNDSALRQNTAHPSLHFKKVGRFWSARVGMHYRALAIESNLNIVWFWIGTHAEYDRLIRLRQN